MMIVSEVFFASPDFSGLSPFVLLIPACLPMFVVAAFHGQSIWPGLLQFILIVSVEILQWRRFRRLSVSFRIFATITIYFAINILSTAAIFCFWLR